MTKNKLIKSEAEIAIMRKAGLIAASILKELKKAIRPGITTKELDELAEKLILANNAKPSFKNFNGYPTATCISINDEIVHGIPSSRKLKKGDLVGIDIGVYFQGYHADTAITVGVGKVSSTAKKLIKISKLALQRGIKETKAGWHLGDVQNVIQETIEKAGFSVIRDLSGHGIGRELQEAPPIPNFGQKNKGLILKKGMTLAIEPMLSAKDYHIKILADGWTIVTADHSLSAHFEHTIAITKKGASILTK